MDEVLLFGNFDETSIQFDMASGHTYCFKGAKEVCLQTTIGVKMKVTVLIAILSSGIVLPPVFIFKSKKPIPQDLIQKYKKDCLIFNNQKGWITEDILLEWYDKIWLNLNLPPNVRPMIIYDKCKVHISSKVLNYLKEKKILHEMIPAGTTGYLQPLDVSINRPLKAKVKERFDQLYSSYGVSKTNRTPAGYLRPPSFDLLIKWILSAYQEIEPSIVVNSFKTTGKNSFFKFIIFRDKY